METTAQFDLNKAVRLWREKLSNAPAITCDAANELEMHLRDSIATLEEKGLTPAEAFWVASHRLGSSESLEIEFSKTNAQRVWVDRLLWMVTGSIVLGLFSNLSAAFGSLATAGVYALTKHLAILGPFSLVVEIAFPAFFVVFFWHAGRRSDGWLRRLGRSLKRTPVKTALVASVLAIVSFAAMYVGHLLSAYTIPVRANVSLVYWTFSSVLMSTVVIPIILGWLLTRSGEKEAAE